MAIHISSPSDDLFNVVATCANDWAWPFARQAIAHESVLFVGIRFGTMNVLITTTFSVLTSGLCGRAP
jgi:hypothetical protein